MLQEKEQREARSNLFDSDSVYGWISILLHWLTAIVIIVLWFIGKGIMSAEPESVDAQRQLHVSIAAGAWLAIMIRIIWRFRSGHPHIRGQTLLIHRVAKVAHYAMLIVLLLMLISGPLIVWTGGHSIAVFDWFTISGPIGESESARELAWFIHSNSAWMLLVLVLLHIGGALKHLMFHADDTIARMIWPGKKGLSK
jgi:cytochrome b561